MVGMKKKELIIAIGADHRGFALKEQLQHQYRSDYYMISWIDVGAYKDIRSDYPEFSIAVCQKMLSGQAQYGILLCGTGVGMAIAANRFATIYAAVAWNDEIARLSKEDDNSNILVIPADFVIYEQLVQMVTAWLLASFKNERYEKRLAMIDEIRN